MFVPNHTYEANLEIAADQTDNGQELYALYYASGEDCPLNAQLVLCPPAPAIGDHVVLVDGEVVSTGKVVEHTKPGVALVELLSDDTTDTFMRSWVESRENAKPIAPEAVRSTAGFELDQYVASRS